MVYVVLVVYITLCAFAFNLRSTEKKAISRYCAVCFIAIGALIAFRGYYVGADTDNYVYQYGNIAAMGSPSESELEIGFYYLIKLLNLITGDPYFLFWVEGIFVAVSYSRFISANVSSIRQAYAAVLGYLAFNLFSFQLSGVRQAFAMCVCLWAFEYVKTKKPIKFLALVAFASTFHTSAWMFLPAYLIAMLKSKGAAKAVSGAVAAFACLNLDLFLSLIASISDRYEEYGVEETGNGYIFFALILLITLMAEDGKDRMDRDGSLHVFYNANYVSFVLWILRLFTRVAERPSFFYLPLTVILMVNLENYFKSDKNKEACNLSICCMLVVLFLYRMSNTPYDYDFSNVLGTATNILFGY